MNKKGLLYLFISSLFVVIIVIVFLTYKQYSFVDRQKVIETRIITINDFIKDIEFDSKRVIFISGFRSLIALEDYVATTGTYLKNDTQIRELFRIAFYNGTINGEKVSVLENSTYNDYLKQLKMLASQIGINIDVNVTNITLTQDSPWSVKVNVTTHVNITDSKSVAHWEFNKTYYTSVALWNIRDPIYSVSTYGRMPNAIRISPYIGNFIGANKNTTNLINHINNSYYINNTLAPSFLMRLQGNFSSDPNGNGIESIVNVEELVRQGFILGIDFSGTKSIVDYIFFSNISNEGNYTSYKTQACDVKNMSALVWFRIDLNHTRYPASANNYNDYYQINQTDLNYTICYEP
jgi:hypothetical protein